MATFTLTGDFQQFDGEPSLIPLMTVMANAEVFDTNGDAVFEEFNHRLVDGTFTITLPAKGAGVSPDDWTYILARKGRTPVYIPAQTGGTFDMTDIMVPSAEPPAGWNYNPGGGGGGSTVSIDADGTLVVDGTTVELATDAQVAALSGVYQPLDADLTAVAGLTPTNDDLIQRKAGAWTNRTPAQVKTDLALTKSDVGLANVDNTSDANKPVSTATAAAIAAHEADTTSVHGIADTSALATSASVTSAINALSSVYQPLDSDLTAIAALSTTSYGRAFLALANQAALMGLLSATSETAQGIVELATQTETNTGTDDARAVTPLKLATRLTAYAQPLDSDLTAIAALTTTAFGRGFLDLADAAAARTKLALGTAATVNTGTASGDIPLLSTGGVLPIARLATGTPDGTKFVRDDGTLATPSGGSTAVGSYYAPPLKVGRYSHNGSANSNAALAVNKLYLTAFPIREAVTIDRIGVNVTVLGASSALRIGLYADDGGYPGALVADYGTVDASTTGHKELTISQSLSAGIAWFALSAQTAGCSVEQIASTDMSAMFVTGSALTGFNNTRNLGVASGVTGALPSTPTWVAINDNNGQRIIIRRSA